MDRQVSTMKEGKKLPEGEVLNPRYLKSCWFLSQRLIAYLQAPVFPADHQKKKKKKKKQQKKKKKKRQAEKGFPPVSNQIRMDRYFILI